MAQRPAHPAWDIAAARYWHFRSSSCRGKTGQSLMMDSCLCNIGSLPALLDKIIKARKAGLAFSPFPRGTCFVNVLPESGSVKLAVHVLPAQVLEFESEAN